MGMLNEDYIEVETRLMAMKTAFAANGRLEQAEEVEKIVRRYLYDYGRDFFNEVGMEKFLELC